MACFTASIFELRHNQIFILLVIMSANLNKISNSEQKNVNILKISMFFYTIYIKNTHFKLIRKLQLQLF
jgi:hypothetical protein